MVGSPMPRSHPEKGSSQDFPKKYKILYIERAAVFKSLPERGLQPTNPLLGRRRNIIRPRIFFKYHGMAPGTGTRVA